ncbi:hypothetical protein [Candidatus Amarolinea aalborgensis]|uniref:hypothetical protein n=1 Tax=Candidatus Amarolinea aalborgensis TaxID=2249329 RepID=UPI003BF9F7A5
MTWLEARPGAAWQTPGGDRAQAPAATAILLADHIWYRMDVTPLVRVGSADNAPTTAC